MKFKTLITEEGDFIFFFYISRPILLVRSKKLQVVNILFKLCDRCTTFKILLQLSLYTLLLHTLYRWVARSIPSLIIIYQTRNKKQKAQATEITRLFDLPSRDSIIKRSHFRRNQIGIKSSSKLRLKFLEMLEAQKGWTQGRKNGHKVKRFPEGP